MQIDLYKPNNPILAEFVNYYYFLDRKSTDKEITYLGFPTTSTFVMVTKGVDLKIDNENISINSAINSSIQSVLFCDNKISGEMNYVGACSEITICFKPLGINVFLENDFSTYCKSIISLFEFESNFKRQFSEIFEIKNNQEKVISIENYLLSILKKEQNSVLKNILGQVNSSNYKNPTVNDLCLKFNISRPTINSYFKKHLGTNPSQYLKIVRFRNTIMQFTANQNSDNLSNTSYLIDYFDQSHMIKDFVSFTGYTPKQFFSKLTQLENGQINWLFL